MKRAFISHLSFLVQTQKACRRLDSLFRPFPHSCISLSLSLLLIVLASCSIYIHMPPPFVLSPLVPDLVDMSLQVLSFSTLFPSEMNISCSDKHAAAECHAPILTPGPFLLPSKSHYQFLVFSCFYFHPCFPVLTHVSPLSIDYRIRTRPPSQNAPHFSLQGQLGPGPSRTISTTDPNPARSD